MTRDELNDLMERRVVEDATEENESPHVFQFRGEHLNGIVVTPLAHEGDRDGTDPSEDAGIFTVEDREPGMRGPISFDPPTMQMLLQTASLVAIDSAALAPEIYNYFLDRIERGSRILVVLTTEDRHVAWRDFLRARWHGNQVFEVVPVKNDPLRTLTTFVTWFNRDQ
jgi:hypothetical protein